MSEEQKDIHCSFCGRSQKEVRRIIAGPGAYICNECIEICRICWMKNRTSPTEAEAAGA